MTGGELAPDRTLDLTDDELRAVALGDSRCVLLECPFTRAGDLMARLVAHLQMKGFRVLLGHPERSPTFLADADGLAELVDRGAFAQLTAGSLRGDFGGTVRARRARDARARARPRRRLRRPRGDRALAVAGRGPDARAGDAAVRDGAARAAGGHRRSRPAGRPTPAALARTLSAASR